MFFYQVWLYRYEYFVSVYIYPADIVFGTVDRLVAVDGGSGLPVAHEGPGLALWGFTH